MKKEKNRIVEALLIGLLDEYMENWHEVDQTWADLHPPEITREERGDLQVSLLTLQEFRADCSNETGLNR